MAHVRLANTNRRTGNDELEGSPGYVSSGEGQWSRARARGSPMMQRRVPKTGGRHTLRQLIAETASALAHMRGRLAGMSDNDPAMPKLMENMDRKAAFLARLRTEQAAS